MLRCRRKQAYNEMKGNLRREAESDLHENSPVLGPGAPAPGHQVHIDVGLAEQKLEQVRVILVSSNPQSWMLNNIEYHLFFKW